MPLALILLDGVRWHGEPVVGERPQALLAALAASGRTVAAERLIDLIWAEDVPANPAKALQVLVSRTRTAAPDSVVRDGDGYRLGVGVEAVDVGVVEAKVRAARTCFATDAAAAARLAGEALALGGALSSDDEQGPLPHLRRIARARLYEAAALRARALSRTGGHTEALPALERAHADDPGDEGVLADLLRSEAATRGVAAALDRYAAYRADLLERLGSEPGPDLRAVHGELLAMEAPVREGVHFDPTPLLGRDGDVAAVRGLLDGTRVVTVLGPGGLGKTRLAHVIGRSANRPVVHFVELVGITDAEDLIGEVGSALGVRDSVSGRRALTPQQRADVRARIAAQLDQAPTLLILDNCEHLIAAVADLVAYLVATTRSLRVLTTSRAPLAIAAETVYPLDALSPADAVDLFRHRALAARPDVHLDGAAVADVVARLDGLPLAIELAAAKVRVMSVADIARRLENRFALLRGGDRSAPDRHQTLLAVIDWSWNLLGEPERRALRRLSVFHDGFTLDAAGAMLGADALAALEDLAAQSLVTVIEGTAGIRYRMLETVREFGRMQLVDAGEDDDAQRAHRAWAVAVCAAQFGRLQGPGQIEAVAALREEDANLSDVLRRALAAADAETVVRLLAALGLYWTLRGDHARLIVLIDAVSGAVAGWDPPPGEPADLTRAALVVTMHNGMIAGGERIGALRDAIRKLGPGANPQVAAHVTIALAMEEADLPAFLSRIREYCASPDRHLALMAHQMLSHVLENSGDPAGGIEAAQGALALVEDSDGPWMRAILHLQLSQLLMQAGDMDGGVRHGRAALPTLERLGAHDDALQVRSLMVLAAISAGRLDEAAEGLAVLVRLRDEYETLFGARLILHLGEAELAIARGELAQGLAAYRAAIDRVSGTPYPGMAATGYEPWILFSDALALTAWAHYAGPADLAFGADLFNECRRRAAGVLDPDFAYLDYPATGMVLFALGSWGLLRDALPPATAARALELARRFAYVQSVPTMAWARIADRAAAWLEPIAAEYGTRKGPELLEDARAFLKELGA